MIHKDYDGFKFAQKHQFELKEEKSNAILSLSSRWQ